jgi:tetratricopeptide (TPR) repeat protein
LKISDKSLEGWIYLSIGGIQQVTIHNENAFTAYSTAIDLFRAANDPQGEANSQFAIGEIQLLKTQTDEAFGSFTAALNSFRSLGDLLGEANSLQMIGDIYQIKGNAKDALSSLQDAADLFLSIGDQLGEANTIMSMGETYAANNENDLALHSYETALHLFHSTGSFRGEANTLAALSRLLVHEGKISEAEQKLREGADLRKQIQDSFDEATDNGNFAIVLLEQKEFAKAAFYAQRARSLFQSISITDRVEKMTRLIDKIQEKSKVFTNSQH